MHQRIRNYIQENGLKFNFVAEKAGIKPKRFYRLMNGESPIGIEEYEKICMGLGLEAGYFFNKQFLGIKNNQEKKAI